MTQTANAQFTKIALFGAGLSGFAAYQRAVNLGICCLIDDDHLSAHEAIAAQDFVPWQDWDFASLDALILSPGIAHHHPAPHAVAQAAQKAGVEIISEVEFGLRTGNWGKLIVVTGTNGKSTTTALTGHILQKAGKPVAVGGNLGTPLCALPQAPEDGITVLELSSYQLETTPSLSPDIAALLNVTPDHLDRHGGLEGYISAKQKCLTACHQDSLALIGDEGALMPQIIRWAQDTLSCQIDLISAKASQLSYKNAYLAGAHNDQNAAFAIAIARACGIKDEIIEQALASFIGLPHRLQPVGTHEGHSFINDSKATNGDASAKALSAYQNILWLAGGRAKEEGLGACLGYASHIRKAYFYGASAEDFASQAQGLITHATHHTLDEAFAHAMQDAQKDRAKDTTENTVILLSPAAASFDQFENFGARGTHFETLVSAYITSQASHETAPQAQEVSHAG